MAMVARRAETTGATIGVAQAAHRLCTNCAGITPLAPGRGPRVGSQTSVPTTAAGETAGAGAGRGGANAAPSVGPEPGDLGVRQALVGDPDVVPVVVPPVLARDLAHQVHDPIG